MNTNFGTGRLAVPAGVTVLLVCLDDEHERLGRKCIQQLQGQLWNHEPAQIVVWTFARLGSPTCRMLATLDAREAHSVVVAGTGSLALSDEVTGWIKSWPVRRPRVPGALIAVLSEAAAGSAADWPDHRLLLHTAARRGLAYSVYAAGPWLDADPVLTPNLTLDGAPRSRSHPLPESLLAA